MPGVRRRYRRWSGVEDRVVDLHWGEEPADVTALRVGRSVAAIRSRLAARGESESLGRGRRSVAAVARTTGYSWDQVLRAVVGSGVRPVRARRDGAVRVCRYLSDDQVERVLAYLGEETRLFTENSRSALADEFGVHPDTVTRWARRVGVGRSTSGRPYCDSDAERIRSALRRRDGRAAQ